MQYRLITVFVLSVCGLDMICVGYLAQQLMDLANDSPPRGPLPLETAIRRYLIANLLPLGASLVAFGISLNVETIWQYVTTFHINVSWWLVVVGGTFVTAGILFLVFDTLNRAVQLLQQRADRGGAAR
ncbi:MAG: hypothetical protein HY303_00840 [Candidatus Wallbacteria bacterium]|nr:hypothetical protein [Candidatus Wallbacteria bacterium]